MLDLVCIHAYTEHMTNINSMKLKALMMEKGLTKESVAFHTQSNARKKGRDFTFRQLDKALCQGIIHNDENVNDLAAAIGCKRADLVVMNLKSA